MLLLATRLSERRTLNALVAGLEVSFEFLETRPRALELRVRNTDLTDSLAGAASVGGQQDVTEAAEVTEVNLDTATYLEPAVQRFAHDDHFTLGTLGTKHFRVAVVAPVHA